MDHCGTYQAHLLDYLYDLLEGEEHQALEAHLARCPSCRTALGAAESQQHLLAAAARLDFSSVRFVPPEEVLTLPERPARKPAFSWGRVAAAAVFLFAVGGLSWLGVSSYRDYESALAVRNSYHTRVDAAAREVADVHRQIQDAKVARGRRDAEIAKAAGVQDMKVVVSGPPAIQPGAPNHYRIETRDLARQNRPVPALLTMRIEDAAHHVLAERKDVASNGDYRLDLPASLEVKPHSRLTLEVLARREGGPEQAVRADLPLAPPVYATYLATDRPLYRPGDTVFFRSLTLQRFNLKPPEEDLELQFEIQKPGGNWEPILKGAHLDRVLLSRGPQPQAVLWPDNKPLRGIGAGEYPLDPQAHGGEWALRVRDLQNRFPPQVRKFLVNRYERHNLLTVLEWSRRSYGEGDAVEAQVRVETADHRPARCLGLATLQIDGKSYGPDGQPGPHPFSADTGADGKTTIRFRLPKTIELGNAILSVKLQDGGNVETLVKPIPIVLDRLNVDFYPEGGDLVTGVKNRVYFQVRNTLGKPADLRGRVVDDTGRVVRDDVATFSVPDQPGSDQGTGAFELTPEAGRSYNLKIDSPIGIRGMYPLPKVKAEGVALSVVNGVSNPGTPIRVELRNMGPARSLLVGAYCRGRLLEQQTVAVAANAMATLKLRPAPEVGGVYRITIFEERLDGNDHHVLRPLAERLVYRVPAHQLHLAAVPVGKQHIPGEQVQVKLSAADETDQPQPAVLLVAVVDRGVPALADEKGAHSMPTHFFLTSEIRRPEDLEHADFLLGPHPKAREALDLLLGTQGWRRFAEQAPAEFRRNPARDTDRVLATLGESRTVDTLARAKEKVRQDYDRQVLQLDTLLVRAETGVTRAREALEGPTFKMAQARVAAYDNLLGKVRQQWLPMLAAMLGVALLLAALIALAVGFLRNSRRAIPLGAGGLIFAALVFGIVLVLPVQHANQGRDSDRFAKVTPPPPRPGAGIAPAANRHPGRQPLIAFSKTAPKDDGWLRRLDQRELQKLAVPAPEREDPQAKQVAEAAQRLEAEQKEVKARVDKVDPTVQPPPTPFVVREYAHQRERKMFGDDEVRSDFAETLYWNPVVVLNDGKGEVSFALSDAVTGYDIILMGNTPDGRIGAATARLDARLPVSLAPKVPVEIGSADQIDVPVTVANNTAEERMIDLHLAAKGLALRDGSPDARLKVPANRRLRQVFHLRPDVVEGDAVLELHGEARPFATDSIRRTFAVAPDGFPIVTSRSDVLEKAAAHEVVLPETWVKGTLQLRAEVYPSTLADLQKGLEALLREPAGCFEQASSSTYPNALILGYLKETDQARPEVERRALALLDQGYRRLTSYECPYPGNERHGYEWFGAPRAAHEALTAYGLLEFSDMARVTKVEPAMLERTRRYLLDQRDGHGGFKRSPRALDTFGRAPQDVTDAYIVWALTESGKEGDLKTELDALAARAKQSQDPYFLALVANGLLNRGRTGEAIALLQTAARQQAEDGHLDAARTSITGSKGLQLEIETTALAVLGWLKANRPAEFNGPLQKAVRWIGRQRGGFGGYGSTQSTVLALKALTGYARLNERTAEAGELRLLVGDAVVARSAFPAGTQDAVTVRLPEPEKYLHAGRNAVRVAITGDRNVFPCTVSWAYRTTTPPSAAGAPVRLATRLDRTTAEEGDTVRLTVTVENARAEGQGMAVAVVGLPAGLALPEDLKQLKEYAALRNHGTERGPIDYFETRGRELVLYWRDLAPRQKVELPIDLVCRVPGTYRGPASRAYLYYDDDARSWAAPLQIHVNAKN